MSQPTRRVTILLGVCVLLLGVVVCHGAEHATVLLQQTIRTIAPGSEGHEYSKSELRTLVRTTARRHGLDPDFFLALVICESSLDPDALSHKGAIGLCQIMPATADELGIDPYDVHENVDGGARYLRRMLLAFRAIRPALWAYNAGPTRVRLAQAGGSLPRESVVYAERVIRTYWRLRALAAEKRGE
jgi:soluble lytic murein transglycosylase-like protein